MGTAIVSYVNKTDSFELSHYTQEIVYPSIEDQKNWSPFMYDSSVLYIQSINPFKVMSIQYEKDSLKAKSRIFSYQEFINGKYICSFKIPFFIHFCYIYNKIFYL
jgi:hypothetical protein